MLLAAALTPAPAGPRGGEKKESKPNSETLEKDLKSDAYDEMMKEKFLACKKTGDCKPYLLEKEKAKKKKDISGLIRSKLDALDKPEAGAAERPPKKPNAEEQPSAEPRTAPAGARRGSPSLASLLARMGELARGAGESAGFISARSVPSPGPGGGFPAGDGGDGVANGGFA